MPLNVFDASFRLQRALFEKLQTKIVEKVITILFHNFIIVYCNFTLCLEKTQIFLKWEYFDELQKWTP